MQEAVVNREKLEEVIANMDKTLSDENERLLNLVEEERLTEEEIDLPQLKTTNK